MRKKEVTCYDLIMAQNLCKKGFKISYVKKVHDGKMAFCFEDNGEVKNELGKMIEAKNIKEELL